MQFDTLIQGGTVVTASDTYASDVGSRDGRVAAIAHDLPRESAKQVLDARGLYVLPGGIDVHTHLDMPFGGTTSADDFQTGTIAAAHGGTTTLIDFAIQYKGQTLREAFDTWMKKADGKDFDAAYVSLQHSAHEEAVSIFQAYAAKPDDEALGAFAKETLPTLEMHLEHVKMMAGKG